MWNGAERGTGQDREGWDTGVEAVLASLLAENGLIRLHLGTHEESASGLRER